MSRFTSLWFLVAFLPGCAAPVKTVTLAPNTPQPIPLSSQKAHKIAFSSIRSALEEGSVIGKHYGGWLKVVNRTYYAPAVFGDGAQAVSCKLVTEELRDAGYETSECASARVFSELEDTSARFAIGGTYLKLSMNTYDKLAGNKSDADVAVRWEVLDRETGEVVYSKEFSSSALGPGPRSDVVNAAERGSFRGVLADPEFVSLVRRSER